MSPNCRQTTIPFRATKNISQSKIPVESCNVGASDDVCKVTPRRSTRRNPVPLHELTPSSALATLEIQSPKKSSKAKTDDNDAVLDMPCREDEIRQLEEFLTDNLIDKTAGSLYISGAPGTGKTAALTHVLETKKVCSGYQSVFVNCTAVKSSSSIYLRIADELKLKLKTRTEKSAIASIETYITRKKTKMILFVLDEIDQLDSKFQTVLYRIFEWPAIPNSKLVLIGIANAVDLTDRVLPRLQALEMQPRLLHFRPYTKEQIVLILRHRMQLKADLFANGALELLAAKVASLSGDLRRAIDLGRRAIELSNSISPKKRQLSEKSDDFRKKTPRKELSPKTPCKTDQVLIENSPRRSPRKKLFEESKSPQKEPAIHANDVLSAVKIMYGSARNLRNDESAFPLHQKLLISTLLLILTKGKNKDVNIGRLHEVYGRVCSKRGITAVDQSGFISLCKQVEMTGAVEIGKGPGKLAKISLQWDETEVSHALQDSSLLTGILADSTVFTRK